MAHPLLGEHRAQPEAGHLIKRTFRRPAGYLIAVAVALLALAGPTVALAQTQSGPRLDFPAGLATDSRTVWVASGRNNTITAIDIASHAISIVAGATFQQGSNDGAGIAARFNSPDGMTLVNRDLYVSDTNNSDIRKIDLGSNTVTTVAGTANISGTEDGNGASAHFNLPTQLANDGNAIYICDSGNNTVRRLTLDDGIVKTIGGQAQQSGKEDGPATKSLFSGPRGIATDGKNVYVSDTGNDLIRKIDLSSLTTSTLAGTGEEGNANGDASKAQFNDPGALCLHGTSLYVMDADNHAVRKIDLSTNQVTTVALANGHLGSGCAISSDGSVLYFSDTTENAVQALSTSNGNYASLYPPGQ